MPVNASGKNTSSTFLCRGSRKRDAPTVLILEREVGWLRADSGTQRLPAALDFGCTSRLALQSPRLADEVCIRPAVGADSAISAGIT